MTAYTEIRDKALEEGWVVREVGRLHYRPTNPQTRRPNSHWFHTLVIEDSPEQQEASAQMSGIRGRHCWVALFQESGAFYRAYSAWPWDEVERLVAQRGEECATNYRNSKSRWSEEAITGFVDDATAAARWNRVSSSKDPISKTALFNRLHHNEPRRQLERERATKALRAEAERQRKLDIIAGERQKVANAQAAGDAARDELLGLLARSFPALSLGDLGALERLFADLDPAAPVSRLREALTAIARSEEVIERHQTALEVPV